MGPEKQHSGLKTSGPLMGVTGIAICFLLLPADSFSSSYAQLERWAPLYAWGSIALPGAILGYIGLWRNDRHLWRIAHGLAFILFCALSVGFCPEAARPALFLAVGAIASFKAFLTSRNIWLIGALSFLIGLSAIALWPSVWPISQWTDEVGGWTGTTSYAAFAANAYARMRGTYQEPNWDGIGRRL